MLKRYLKSNSGNMAIVSAIGMSVMLVAIGAAVDISQTSNQKQTLQDMVDNAVLAAAKSKKTKISELQVIVDSVIAQHNIQNLPIQAKVRIENDVVFVEADSKYDTWLMGVVGKDKVDLKADAASPMAKLTPVNVALVLDTTDSMAGDNIKNLKTAAKEMIDDFRDFDSNVRMAVIPFGKYVNVGMSNKNASWIDTSKDGTFDEYEHCYDEYRTIKARVCTGTGTYRDVDTYSDGVKTGTNRVENQSCEDGIYEPTGNTICEMRRTDYTWYGCAGSRQSPYNEQAPYAGRRIPGIMNETCGTELRTLTSDLDDVEDTIDELTTSGETYLPAGIMWGWRAMQKDVPFTQITKGTTGKNTIPSNAMVIMTDGENTLSQGGDERHNGNDKKAANKRTAALCEGAKADGLQIFTVGYRMDSSRKEMEELLEACATTPDNYFDAGNAAELKKAFKDIASRLDFTRLSM